MKLFDRLGKLRDRRRPYCTMIVPAAGESRRMGGGNKLLLPLEGEPVLAHTLRAIDAATLVDEIILSTRTECLAEMADPHPLGAGSGAGGQRKGPAHCCT